MNRKKHNTWKRIVVLALCLFLLFPPVSAASEELAETETIEEVMESESPKTAEELLESEAPEEAEELMESETPEIAEEPLESEAPETTEESLESEEVEEAEEAENQAYASQTFLDMPEEEQILYIQGLDEAAFYELLGNLIDDDKIIMVGEEGFELTEDFLPEDDTEEPIISGAALQALGEKWLEIAGSAKTFSMSSSYFNPATNVTTETVDGVTKFTLTGDVTVTNQIQISSSENYTIDLAGHTMEMSNNGCYFMINPGGTLTIEDSVGGGVVYNKTYLVWLYNGGTFNLNGGTIDGSQITSAAQQGGAVYLGSPMQEDEVFNMYGGTIQNCSSTQGGGAVYVSAPSSGHYCYFNMYGGSILNCSSVSGGAIYVGSQGTDRSVVHLEGRSKITLLGNSATGRGGAIYSDGKVEISGILDIGHGKSAETGYDSVYIAKNNWSGYVPEYLDVTGRLVVVGDGYIDLDTEYPSANAIVQGHTVVKNSTDGEITPTEFYTYGSYFINSTRGLTVSAGFDPSQNADYSGNTTTTSAVGPGNWHTYNSDTGNYEHQTYVDVIGQTMYVEATSEPGKREYQDYNYLIYTERSVATAPILEYFSVKIIKQDEEGNELDGAEFSLNGTVYDVYGVATSDTVSGVSGATGSGSGVSTGETYIYTDDNETQKLMLRDGVYTITETQPPTDYTARENFMTIKIEHDNSGEASVVVVSANNTVLTETSVSIGSIGDAGQLVEHEIVLTVTNSKEEVQQKAYTVNVEKYSDSGYTTPLPGAAFGLYSGDDMVASGTTSSEDADKGKATLTDGTDSYTLNYNNTVILNETSPPDGYYAISDISISVDESGAVTVGGVSLTDGGTVTSGTEGNTSATTYGSWQASLSGDNITFKVYDEPEPVKWTLSGTKYGTQAVSGNGLAGAKFGLYEADSDGKMTETLLYSVTSGSNGTFSFNDTSGSAEQQNVTLQAGTYYLKETSAPQGYQLAKTLKIVIGEDGTSADVYQEDENGDYTVELTSGNTSGNNAGNQSADGATATAVVDSTGHTINVSIVDEALYALPETGGRGIYMGLMLSILLMCVTGSGWQRLRRKVLG